MPAILDQYGKPYVKERPSPVEAHDLKPRRRREREKAIEALYDNAQTTTHNVNHWSRADAKDADSANSIGVRSKLVQRSRYEGANNGYLQGIYRTHATYLVRSGPQLQLRTANPDFNRVVETLYRRWARTVQLRRKLWCAAHAKVQDGEPIILFVRNPKLRNRIKLGLQVLETEQCQSPQLMYGEVGYIDGIKFDEYGNPIHYDILPAHPGGEWSHLAQTPRRVPAKFVGHWFKLERPGQHRGVPEFASTLGVGATSRRHREATVAAAETAADISLWLQTTMPPNDEAQPVAPFSEVDWDKRMAVMAPMGWQAQQMRAEHPNAQYESFHRQQISETARPRSMPHNLAACDSSGHNFASGKLDYTPYHLELDQDRLDCEDLVLDPMFDLWWAEAVATYEWNADPDEPPEHGWSWDLHPIADAKAAADATRTRLQTGQVTMSHAYEETGRDYDDDIVIMANDYGVPVEEMKRILLGSIFTNGNMVAPPKPEKAEETDETEEPDE